VIGAELFVRTSRSVRLTPVGEQLRVDLIPVYRGLMASMERARMAAKGVTGTLRVGMLAINGHELKPYWTEFRKRHPDWELRSGTRTTSTPSGCCGSARYRLTPASGRAVPGAGHGSRWPPAELPAVHLDVGVPIRDQDGACLARVWRPDQQCRSQPGGAVVGKQRPVGDELVLT